MLYLHFLLTISAFHIQQVGIMHFFKKRFSLGWFTIKEECKSFHKKWLQMFGWSFGFMMTVLFISRQWLKSEDIQRISLLFYNKILEKEVSLFFFYSKSIGFSELVILNSCISWGSCFLHVVSKLLLSELLLASVVLSCMHCFSRSLATQPPSLASQPAWHSG